MKKIITLLFSIITFLGTQSQTVTVQVDALAGQKPISPNIYGKNNSLSDAVGSPLSSVTWQKFRDTGLRMFRENGGNNATKYNWRRKLSSHPDWYNNVYSHDWDFASNNLQSNMTGVSCMWAFQLIGKTASNKNNNFNDWAYNSSQWWSGCAQNLAGGGVVNAAGGSAATTNGNPDLYLMNWPADSTVTILDKWFGAGGLGLSKSIFKYWNMDNEPEIWNGTHDDIMPTQLAAEDFMQRYFAVAKLARAKFPEIKLTGPVVCNEWQWYNWDGNLISYGGKNYTWLEFFIKRIGEEQTASGIKLLDVIDLHFYPGESAATDIVQLHRVFFDKTYDYPGANGLKKINGGWDNSQTKEYVFERCKTWLNTYLGSNHGVTLGLSEIDVNSSTPSVVSNWYASMLGTFADQGVELFTPWSWKIGMWETLHLFSRYGKTTRVQSASNLEQYVSAYSSINNNSDSLTVILVNRSTTTTYTTKVKLDNFTVANGNYNTLTLSNLGANETFVSHAQNALVTSSVAVAGDSLSVSLPPLSIKAVILSKGNTVNTGNILASNPELRAYFDNNQTLQFNYKLGATEKVEINLYNLQGIKLSTIENSIKPEGFQPGSYDGSALPRGIYLVQLKSKNYQQTIRVAKQ